MKTKLFLVLLVISRLFANAENDFYQGFLRQGIKCRIEALVKTELGEPVPDAEVRFVFSTGRGREVVKAFSDTNGLCSAVGYSNIDILIHASKCGFYESKKTIRFSNLGREEIVKAEMKAWEKHPCELVLRKVKHRNTSSRHYSFFRNMPTNVWVQLDLDNARYWTDTERFGNGDIQVFITCHGKDKFGIMRCGVVLQAFGKESGFMLHKKNLTSEFMFQHEAPHAGYTNPLALGCGFKDEGGLNLPSLTEVPEDPFCVFKTIGHPLEGKFRFGVFIRISPEINEKKGTATLNAIYYFNSINEGNNIEYQNP